MFENGYGYFVVDVTDEDMDVNEKWLVKVIIIEETADDKEEEGEVEYVSKKLVFELIQKFSPDENIVLCFEVEKLPTLYLLEEDKVLLDQKGRMTLNIPLEKYRNGKKAN